MKRIALWIATFFGVGKMPIAPGTWASLVTTVVVYVVQIHSVLVLPVAAALIYVLGIPAASVAENVYQKKDPGACVIDEVAGQLVTLSFLPHSLWLYAAAFFLFRLFDIAKPFPVRQSERLPHGLGIMTDDILAGLYGAIVLQLAMVVWKAIA